MFVDEELSESFVDILKLLEVKQKHNLTDHAFNDILNIFTNGEISLHSAKKKLSNLVNLQPVFIDMCINSCCAFTGQLTNDLSCHWCGQNRFIIENQNKNPRKVASFFPLIDRFKLQFNDPQRALALRYRHEYVTNENYEDDNIGDLFDGNLYKELVDDGYFSDERDIALIGSTDGYQIFRQKTDDCWIVMFINSNLSPNERFKKQNLLISLVIPGPKQPKNFNSFLKPVIDELKILEGNNLSIYNILVLLQYISFI
jgi:hypothetical protein